MRIWLLTIGEPVPLGAGVRDRLHRTGALARYLVSRGHEVVWWTSGFDHFRKQHLVGEDTFLTEPDGLRIRLLRGCGYQRNVSLERFRDHRQVAERFRVLSELERKPEILVSALPTVEMCLAAEEFGRRNSVPTVIDLRDMWPDILADVAPSILRPVARLAMAPLFLQARRACALATALTGITEAFVDWGLKRGRRRRSELDQAFPFTYNPERPAEEELRAADAFWDGHGIHARHADQGGNETGKDELVVCYFGNIGVQLDLGHVIEAARLLEARGKRVRFVLCGEGERLEEYRSAAQGLRSVVFPGWVNRAAIYSLMRRSSVGLDPLPERMDFLASINNKAIEYLSAGLPVVSSPERGVLFELLRTTGSGVSYASHNAESLAGCMDSLAEGSETLGANPGRMRANAQALFDREFRAEVMYPAMEAHLMAVREHYCAGRVVVVRPGRAEGITA
jgi:glycosyltransferase involved in cell wall biosynthesis